MNINNYYLDDSTVLDFHKHNDDIILKLQGAMTLTEKYIDGILTLHGTSNLLIKINPKDTISPHQDIGMFYEDGSLYGINIEKHSISFLIKWINFKTHIHNDIYYAMNFDNLTWQTISEEREEFFHMNSD
jgi:hypothetical protein